MNAEQIVDPRMLLDNGAAALGVKLDAPQLERLLELARLVLEKNRELNLTGAHDLATLIGEHLLDALTLVPLIRGTAGEGDAGAPETGARLVDVGSGGGFPALPLAVVLRELQIACVESVAKKARAVEGLRAALGLTNVTVVNARAEAAAHEPQWREKADWATARGVGSLSTVCELTLPFLRLGGKLLAQKGAEVETEMEEACFAIGHLGGMARRIQPVGRARPQGRRLVVVIEKVEPTPAEYPRRPGVPARRPLKD